MAAALALLMAGALLLPAWQAKPDDPEIEGAFRAWMNQDVVYIITPPEREAFLKLSTNSERAKFVEEFWLRRDPTPGTPQNEMMEEHYRRLAYSNQRFAGTKAGWATDRGRVYIQYGPPDEIESHPSETTPYEEWKYRYLGGIGDNVIVKFVKHDGEYQWTRDKEK